MAMEKIIIVNSGSVSKKYALYKGEELVLSAHFEVFQNNFQVHFKSGENFEKSQKVDDSDFESAFDYFINLLIEKKIILKDAEISAVSFRIVAPGLFFQKDALIDKNFLSKIDEIKDSSLIHIKSMQIEMNQVIDRLPGTKLFAISDSAFHSTIPEYAKTYALPESLIKEDEIYRYGYHGISVSSVVENLKKEDKLPSKTIICHLGGGSSITAVLNGKSIENSMGYTPLEGLPMATRSGDIDPGALLLIMEQNDYEPYEMRDILFNKSGLLAISEKSSDIRDLIEESEKGNQKAKLALDVYVYHIQKIIGSYFIILGGLDLIVFTGTVGERSYIMRDKICKNLSVLGINIDSDLNKKNNETNSYINSPKSPVSILIKKTDEMAEMARKTNSLLK